MLPLLPSIGVLRAVTSDRTALPLLYASSLRNRGLGCERMVDLEKWELREKRERVVARRQMEGKRRVREALPVPSLARLLLLLLALALARLAALATSLLPISGTSERVCGLSLVKCRQASKAENHFFPS